MSLASDDPGAPFRAAAARPGTILIEGFHALKHAVRFGAVIRAAVCADKAAAQRLATDLAPDLVPWLRAHLVEVGPEGLRALAARPPETAVLAVADRPADPLAGLPRGAAPIVFLDRPTHLGNIGAVVRTAAAAGAAAVVTTGQYDPWSPAALRGSAGLHFALPVGRLADPPDWDLPLLAFDAAGEPFHGAVPDGAVLAFGSERRGLSAAVRARAHKVLALPMRDGVSSLNLAASVAAVLYAWRLGLSDEPRRQPVSKP